ncbi:MAG: pro-sigmaK processing inhibitor BofA family protein [Acutalibacteraceae bacterium]
MKAFNIFTIIILSIFFLGILLFSIKSHKFIKILLFNAFIGVCILAIIDLTAKFTGIYIPVNIYSVVGSATFGVPAVCGFLLLQIIFV